MVSVSSRSIANCLRPKADAVEVTGIGDFEPSGFTDRREDIGYINLTIVFDTWCHGARVHDE